MKRLTFLAIIAALFSVNAAKAQVGVHVGLNFGTPYYHNYQRRVVYAQPAYYPPAYPVYDDSYNRRPVVVEHDYYQTNGYYNNYYRHDNGNHYGYYRHDRDDNRGYYRHDDEDRGYDRHHNDDEREHRHW